MSNFRIHAGATKKKRPDYDWGNFAVYISDQKRFDSASSNMDISHSNISGSGHHQIGGCYSGSRTFKYISFIQFALDMFRACRCIKV